MKTKPKIEVDLAQVEILASRGLTKEQIADALGISYSTLNRRQKDLEDLEDAIKRGKAKSISFVAGKLQKLIDEGNLGAIIFFLKTQGGWTETVNHQHGGIPGGEPIHTQGDFPELTNEEILRIANLPIDDDDPA